MAPDDIRPIDKLFIEDYGEFLNDQRDTIKTIVMAAEENPDTIRLLEDIDCDASGFSEFIAILKKIASQDPEAYEELKKW